jgi:hypothetical protein
MKLVHVSVVALTATVLLSWAPRARAQEIPDTTESVPGMKSQRRSSDHWKRAHAGRPGAMVLLGQFSVRGEF